MATSITAWVTNYTTAGPALTIIAPGAFVAGGSGNPNLFTSSGIIDQFSYEVLTNAAETGSVTVQSLGAQSVPGNMVWGSLAASTGTNSTTPFTFNLTATSFDGATILGPFLGVRFNVTITGGGLAYALITARIV